jgi:hypothetical protein
MQLNATYVFKYATYLSTNDLIKYASELKPPKPMFLLINKSDYLSDYQREMWARELEGLGIKFAFYSAAQSQKRIDMEAAAQNYMEEEMLSQNQNQNPMFDSTPNISVDKLAVALADSATVADMRLARMKEVLAAEDDDEEEDEEEEVPLSTNVVNSGNEIDADEDAVSISEEGDDDDEDDDDATDESEEEEDDYAEFDEDEEFISAAICDADAVATLADGTLHLVYLLIVWNLLICCILL